MDSLLQDVRYGIRALSSKPGFTAVAVLTIALGIGANTAMFTVVNAVLLRALPYPHPEQLVRITADLRGTNIPDIGLSVPELTDYREKLDAIDQIAGVWPISANITGTDQPERVEVLLASANYFTLLGAQPQLGRVFGPEDEIPGITEIAVISDALWRRSFGGDPKALGQKIRIDDDVYTIIGVMPSGFRHRGRTVAAEVDLWAPAGFRALPFGPPTCGGRILQGALARPKPGVAIEQAQQQLDALASALRNEYPNDYPAQANWSPTLVRLQEDLVGKVKPALLILLAAVGLVLLIACVNIANLLLARWSVRQREVATRLALGAGRGRLVGQMPTESVLVSLAGGALALLTSLRATDALKALTPSNIPRLAEAGLDARVFAFAFVISVVTGIAFGAAPALLSSNPSMQLALKEGDRGGGSGDPSSLSKAVQREVQLVDPELPVFSIKPMEEMMASATAERRFSMMLFGIFAALAMMPTPASVCGVMSYTVAQRTHEIGIRIALGARAADVLKMIVGQATGLALIGVGVGLTLAFALTRLMSSLLFGVSTTDPVTFAAISVTLTAVALPASYIPARRATKVNPMVALRDDRAPRMGGR